MMYKVTCQHCGEEFEVSRPSHQKVRKYCSKKCYFLHKHNIEYLYKAPFPTVRRFENKKDYVKRCMNNEAVAARYPNRKIRKQILEEYHKTVPYKERNQLFTPGKVLFVTDAIEYLGVAEGTLKHWEYRGYLKPGWLEYDNKKYRTYQVEMLDEIKRVRDEAFRKKQESNRNKMDSLGD